MVPELLQKKDMDVTGLTLVSSAWMSPSSWSSFSRSPAMEVMVISIISFYSNTIHNGLHRTKLKQYKSKN